MKYLFKTKVATSIRNDYGFTIVRYHDTDIVKFNDKEIVLRHNGWNTHTTKSRMNEASRAFALGYTVFQKDFTWYIDYNNKVIDFKDGIVLRR